MSFLYVSHPQGAVGWSAVCDCGISWSYSLTFFHVSLLSFQFKLQYVKGFETVVSENNHALPENIVLTYYKNF